MRDKYFSWQSWANFGNEGEKPTLNKYTYTPLKAGSAIPLSGTSLKVIPYLLSHVNPYSSTAFLIENNTSSILYLGDTGADRLEKSDKLDKLWDVAASRIRSHQLKTIFIEVSFSNDQPEHQLFGHLTPKLLMEEMQRLQAKLPPGSMKNFPIVITHMKPAGNRIQTIISELQAANTIGLQLVFPEQGRVLHF